MEGVSKELKLSSSKKPFFITTGYCHGGNSDRGTEEAEPLNEDTHSQTATIEGLPLPRPSYGLS